MGILAYRGVSKRFGQHTALEGVSLEVAPGEVFGLLGPNGAGKTTLIRIGLDILRADEGEVLLFGAAPSPTALDRTAYLPEERGVYRRAKVRELLTYLGRLKGLKRAAARKAGDHACVGHERIQGALRSRRAVFRLGPGQRGARD